MTSSETDRLRSQLSRLEDRFPGYRTEIAGGKPVEVALEIGRAKIETDELPIDRETRIQRRDM
ncbi:hypothetical protein ACH4RA_30175 [Streptomyces smyrnaeus]|uniref:hypothetical protein n=1 Tax=Streptomyces TaxID=1883 RepID=UPI0018181180|nr:MULTISPECIES: hypothetical protein [unclassified Streptomyces]